jgi:(E)-4-hydroxy-3-methyl-but-2-enyl pyrophosphate reductase
MDILLPTPRGFCAGVERAISIVERALEKYGAPIYVRHEVVHNRYVVDGLKAKGAVFVEELTEVPDGATVIFSAHGVPQAVRREADARGLRVFDATCPLVTKVHLEVSRLHKQGYEIVMIGHKGHPEVEGTMGQATGMMYLVESVEDVASLRVPAGTQGAGRGDAPPLAYVTQTTLSVDDAQAVVAALRSPLSGHRRAEEGRHLLRHTEPPGCRQIDGRQGGCGDRGRFEEQLQLQSPARGCGARRGAGLPGGRSRADRSAMAAGQVAYRPDGRCLGAGGVGRRRDRTLPGARRGPRGGAARRR